jgi:hypothetical protein
MYHADLPGVPILLLSWDPWPLVFAVGVVMVEILSPPEL